MNHFVYSDPHFNHKNVIRYSNRPFEDTEDMKESLIQRFNEVVKPTDAVFILGDFGFGTKEELSEIVSRLNGYKTLIMGNHDWPKPRKWWLGTGFDEVSKHPILIQNKFLLSHHPLTVVEGMPYVNVHGHIHQNPAPTRMHFNVSVEQTDYKPVNLKAIEKEIKKRGIKLVLEDYNQSPNNTEWAPRIK